MFHVVYSRHYWDHQDGSYGTFPNTYTLYRNVSYSQIEITIVMVKKLILC